MIYTYLGNEIEEVVSLPLALRSKSKMNGYGNRVQWDRLLRLRQIIEDGSLFESLNEVKSMLQVVSAKNQRDAVVALSSRNISPYHRNELSLIVNSSNAETVDLALNYLNTTGYAHYFVNQRATRVPSSDENVSAEENPTVINGVSGRTIGLV